MRRRLLILLLCLLSAAGLRAAEPAFDLAGPKVDVHVRRGEVTLPIGAVPALLPGDRLWIHPDLPESQSAHFVLVVAFLRGATNPPPPEWFIRVETWNRTVRSEGVFVTVPAEAQQALLFLAPETGGDFSTLRAAVRGRPGAFVRAGQDLVAAGWDRMRLDAFLAEVKITAQTDSRLLKTRTEMAARSLGIRLDQQCFDKPTDQQAPCLVEHTDGVVLDDSNAGSLVRQWTSGDSRDLMNAISSTTLGGAGSFSPYIGAVIDTARILSSLHTAHFQYIPALALPTKDTLNLRLSVPPSFRDPKSVVVVALPPVGPAKMPALHPVNPTEVFCAQNPGLVLAAEGAPLVFSTSMARDLTLHLDSKNGNVDIPLRTDPSQGGLVPDRPAPLLPEEELNGVVRGKWGFEPWEGPRFHLRSAQPGRWTLTAASQSALVVGRDDILQVEGSGALCVEHTEIQTGTATPQRLLWKAPKPDLLEIAVPLKDASPGPVSLRIFQYGLEKPDALGLNAYAEAASLDRLTLSAGDHEATLRGTRLDEVAQATLGALVWSPSTLSRVQDFDQLTLNLPPDASTAQLEPGKPAAAVVQLRDGRALKVLVIVNPPRPRLTLLSRGVQTVDSAAPSPVHLSDADDLPLEGRLVFFLRSEVPEKFPRAQKVEIAAEDGGFRTLLSLSDNSLMLEDARTAVGVIDPLARFGASAFGPVRLRAISPEGVAGDWIPLGTLVRLPGFRELHCPHTVARSCTLTGSNLFLAAAIAATPDFDDPIEVPPDFTGTQLAVPHPAGGILYLKLRDDSDAVQTLTLPLTTAVPGAPIPPIAVTPVVLPASGATPTPASGPQSASDSALKP